MWTHFGSNNLVEQIGGFYQLALFHARIGSRRTIHRTSVDSELKLLKLL